MSSRDGTGPSCMTRLIASHMVSFDGFSAGPDQTLETPLGKGGEALHVPWFFESEHPADRARFEELNTPVDARSWAATCSDPCAAAGEPLPADLPGIRLGPRESAYSPHAVHVTYGLTYGVGS